MEVKVCSNCGKENPLEANFCRGCGVRFMPQNGVTSPVQTPGAAKPKGKLDKIIVAVTLAVLVVAVCVGIFYLVNAISDQDVDVVENVQVYMPETLAGDYSMKLISGDLTSRYAAVVKEYAENNYRVEVITEYGKSIYTFVSNSDGTVESPELGKGTVKYKESVKKLTVEFIGGDLRCELTRIL